MNFLPLCTASVWPTNSGAIVDAATTLEDLSGGSGELLDPPVKLLVDEGSLLERRPMPRSYFFRRVTGMESDGRAARRVLVTFVGCPMGSSGGALALALAPAHRVVDGSSRCAHRRTKPFQRTRPALPTDIFLVVEVADLAMVAMHSRAT